MKTSNLLINLFNVLFYLKLFFDQKDKSSAKIRFIRVIRVPFFIK